MVVPKPKRVKIGPKTIDCVFIGYAHNSSAFRFLVHKSDIPDIHVNTFIESREATFFENVFPYKSAPESTTLKRPLDTTNDDTLVDQEPSGLEPRRSKRARIATSFGPNFLTNLIESEPQRSLKQCPLLKLHIGKKQLIAKLSPFCKTILGNWWIFHLALNL